MMDKVFSFDNAAFHFARTSGPSGYMWKHALSYLLLAGLIVAVSYFLMKPLWDVYGQAMAEVMMLAETGGPGDPAVMAGEISTALMENALRILLGQILIVVLGVMLWAAFEAAIQRRYVRDEGFSLRFGGDELRIIVVGLIWMAMFIGGGIVTQLAMLGLVMPVATMVDNPAVAGIWGFVVGLSFIAVWIYFTVRWSAAAALTIRDRKIRFFDSWGATKGRFWTMLGAFLVLWLILGVVFFILYAVGVTGLFGSAMMAPGVMQGTEPDMTALMEYIMQPAFLAAVAALYAVMIGFQAIAGYIWAGVAALAAKTDPRGGGMVHAASAFD
jgi:hypothetical protein